MSTAELPIAGRFPTENIQEHGPIQVQSMSATVVMAPPKPPSKDYTVHILEVEMSCTGNLDTHTILVEDASLLRMFVMKNGAVVVDLASLNTVMPVFKLEAAGPLSDNNGEEDTDEDFEMLQDAWKTCRLVWGHNVRLARSSKQMNKKKAEKDVADQTNNAEPSGLPVAQTEKQMLGSWRPAYGQQPARPSRAATTTTPSVRMGGHAFSQPEDDEYLSNAGEAMAPAEISSAQYHNEEDSEDYNEVGYEDEDDDDFEESSATKTKRPGAHKVSKPSQKALGKQAVKSTTPGLPRKTKPRNPAAMIWPTTIITTGTAGGYLRPLMEELGQTLTTDAERQQYMDLVWTRRRAAERDDAAKQSVVDDLETFVRTYGIVDQHNLWARWMESGIKVAMPMYKPVGSGEMDVAERKQMFERKKKARRG
ncbi:hypothetical protein G6011_11785 [Alternaria panax]|uniref:Uncharacterized protein n=1 Tax=Alternaria panax TaxID=48097 RepID=A0AAD4F8P3_9PLEO|nr:hypothetical protein G6011_11785 [Alternaria panax]